MGLAVTNSSGHTYLVADAIYIAKHYPGGIGPLTQSDLLSLPREQLYRILGGAGDYFPVPVGVGRPNWPLDAQSAGLPPVATQPGTSSPGASPGQTNGTQSSPNQGGVSQRTGPKPMDLGTIITDLGSQWIQTKWGGGTNAAAIPGLQSQFSSFIEGTDIDIPFVDVISDNPGKGYIYDPTADCGKGKWIKKRRRRRKTIITQSEVGQLQSLFAAAGKGEIAKLWLAKRA